MARNNKKTKEIKENNNNNEKAENSSLIFNSIFNSLASKEKTYGEKQREIFKHVKL